MRKALLASVLPAAAVGAVVGAAAAIAFAPDTEAAAPPPFSARAGAEIQALAAAEANYYREHGRYTDRLADLFATTRFGTAIVMNSAAVEIDLDVSTDRRTVIIRATSPTVALSRVLVRGRETGRTCEVLAPGALCR